MPITREDKKKYAPKTVKFSDLYKHTAQAKELGNVTKSEAKAALEKAGFQKSRISKIISNNQELSLGQMKKVAANLRGKVHGFNQSGSRTVDNYLQKEITKRKNIARLIQDRHTEAIQEGEKTTLSNEPKTSLSSKASGLKPTSVTVKTPNSYKRINLVR